jgi:hypothetical protein
MVWELTIATFVATVIAAAALFYVFSQRYQVQKAWKKVQEYRVAGDFGNLALNRRRSERTVLRVPVLVYGHALGEEPFYEEATTIQVSAHGGLLALTSNVRVGQKLLLTNNLTQEEQQCEVVRFGPRHPQKVVVAFEFARPVPSFWRTEAHQRQTARL